MRAARYAPRTIYLWCVVCASELRVTKVDREGRIDGSAVLSGGGEMLGVTRGRGLLEPWCLRCWTVSYPARQRSSTIPGSTT